MMGGALKAYTFHKPLAVTMNEDVEYGGEYVVLENAQVTMSVIIGYAQMGSSIAYFTDKPVEVWIGGIENTALGTGAEVVGRTLRIRTTVTDYNPHSNSTSVNCVLSGGASAQPGVFGSSKEVGENESITYVGTIHFVL